MCVRHQIFSSPISTVAIPALQAVLDLRQVKLKGWSHQLQFSCRNPCHRMPHMLNAPGGEMYLEVLGAKITLMGHRVPNS